MTKRTGIAAGALMALAASPAFAAEINAARMLSNFTVITFGDLTMGAETEGTAFVGGDLYDMRQVNPRGLANGTAGAHSGALIVGGTHHGGGQLQSGDAVIGAFAQGASFGNNGGGTVTEVGLGVVDVAGVAEAMRGLSLSLAALSADGPTAGTSAQTSDQNRLSVTAADGGAGYAAITTDGGDWLRTGTWQGVLGDTSVTTIVNVPGRSITIGANFNQTLSNVVFNFFEARNIQLNVAFNYTVLAPLADVMLQGGGVNGTVAANSIVQNAEIRPTNFSGDLPEFGVSAVPAPAAAALLPAGLGALALMRRRRRA